MANSEFPWFRFMARDALTDERWQVMPAIARGVYIQFLAYQWENDGLPPEVEALARLASFAHSECLAYSTSEEPLTPLELFESKVWPYLESMFPPEEGWLKGPLEKKEGTHGDPCMGHRLKNRKLAAERSEIDRGKQKQSDDGRRGAKERERRKRLRGRKGGLRDPTRDPTRDPQASRARSEPDADDEDPLTPTSGGPDRCLDVDSGGRINSRAAGTNPRAVAVERETFERQATDRSESAERQSEERRRGALIRQLDPGGTIRGTYSGGLGFRLWNHIKLPELEQLATKRNLGAPVPFPGLPRSTETAAQATEQAQESTRDVQT